MTKNVKNDMTRGSTLKFGDIFFFPLFAFPSQAPQTLVLPHALFNNAH